MTRLNGMDKTSLRFETTMTLCYRIDGSRYGDRDMILTIGQADSLAGAVELAAARCGTPVEALTTDYDIGVYCVYLDGSEIARVRICGSAPEMPEGPNWTTLMDGTAYLTDEGLLAARWM